MNKTLTWLQLPLEWADNRWLCTNPPDGVTLGVERVVDSGLYRFSVTLPNGTSTRGGFETAEGAQKDCERYCWHNDIFPLEIPKFLTIRHTSEDAFRYGFASDGLQKVLAAIGDAVPHMPETLVDFIERNKFVPVRALDGGNVFCGVCRGPIERGANCHGFKNVTPYPLPDEMLKDMK